MRVHSDRLLSDNSVMESSSDALIVELRSKIHQNNHLLAEKDRLLAKKDKQLDAVKAELSLKENELSIKDNELSIKEAELNFAESNLLSMHIAVKEAVGHLHERGWYVPAASLSLIVVNFDEILSGMKRSRGARSLQVVAGKHRQELHPGRFPGREVAHETSGGHVHRQGDRRSEDAGPVRGDSVRASDGRRCLVDLTDFPIPTSHAAVNSSLIELYLVLGLVEAM